MLRWGRTKRIGVAIDFWGRTISSVRSSAVRHVLEVPGDASPETCVPIRLVIPSAARKVHLTFMHAIRFLRACASLWFLMFALALTTEAQQITFRDITAEAGIRFTHNN